jgi:hypothetical protein
MPRHLVSRQVGSRLPQHSIMLGSRQNDKSKSPVPCAKCLPDSFPARWLSTGVFVEQILSGLGTLTKFTNVLADLQDGFRLSLQHGSV